MKKLKFKPQKLKACPNQMKYSKLEISKIVFTSSEADFKEFEPRLKYGLFHFKLYPTFKD